MLGLGGCCGCAEGGPTCCDTSKNLKITISGTADHPSLPGCDCEDIDGEWIIPYISGGASCAWDGGCPDVFACGVTEYGLRIRAIVTKGTGPTRLISLGFPHGLGANFVGGYSGTVNCDGTSSVLTKTVTATGPCVGPATITVQFVSDAPTCPASEPDCEPPIFHGDYGVLILEGTFGGEPFKVCLAYSYDDETEEESYSGTLENVGHPDCPAADLDFVVFCKVDGETRTWVLRVSDGVTTVDIDITVTDGDPLDATVSGTLTGICDDAVIVAGLSACDGEMLIFPACCSLTAAEKCCVTEIPPFVTSGSAVGGPGQGTISWTGSVAWNPVHVDGPGWYANVAFNVTGCTPAKPQLNAATSITCDSGGTFQLLMPDLLSIVDTDTGGCPTVGGVTLSFQMQVLGGWCDGSDANVTLVFTA